MAEIENIAHFQWTPAEGQRPPDGYLFETSSGQTGQVYSESLWVPWSWAGSGNPITFHVKGFHSNILGEIEYIGPPSPESDPVTIVPEPGFGLLFTFGIIALLMGRKLRR